MIGTKPATGWPHGAAATAGGRGMTGPARLADARSIGPALVVPRRLATDRAPAWSYDTDVVVVGSGVAGLTAALHVRRLGLRVTVVTKSILDEGSTRWAQGGIVAVLRPQDSPSSHAVDTMVAGAGLCDPAAVDVLTSEGPDRVRELVTRGARFDREDGGGYAFTREGGHRTRRIIHAGGDATGAEIQRALHAAVRHDPAIRVVEHALALDLLTDAAGRAAGVLLHAAAGERTGVGAVLARAVVLATGGMGQLFRSTTNPAVSTGDGVALALRAGAAVTDLEFLQFHPTALHLPGADLPQLPLLTEALRGEGAHLLDTDGRRFLLGAHELAELAPRDVVARASTRAMLATGADHVLLDARHLGRAVLESRFPNVTARCRQAGVDPVHEPIPAAPAAHFASGGVRTDLWGRTTVPGLYACGEVACTGVHGANRLASNSLLEGLVFAGRVAADLARELPPQADPVLPDAPAWAVDPAVREPLRRAMGDGAGVLRTAASLESTDATLRRLAGTRAAGDRAAWEATNLVTLATALVTAARLRRETRGCHWRGDHGSRDDAWHGHLLATIDPDGGLTSTFRGTPRQ